MKKHLLRLVALAVPLAAFLVLAAPAFAQGSPPTFQTADTYDLPPETTTPVDITNADFDGDGDLDLATVNTDDYCGAGNPPCVTVFVNDGTGDYSAPPTTSSSLPWPTIPPPSTSATSTTTASQTSW